MDNLNRPLYGSFAIFILFLSFWSCWFSLSGYFAFLKLSDVIIFSWKLGFMIFVAPLMFYFSFLAIYSVIKNKFAKMNNKLTNVLAIIAVLGAVISLFLSMYISQNLKDNGYNVCPRKSWMAPNEYVRDLKLCP